MKTYQHHERVPKPEMEMCAIHKMKRAKELLEIKGKGGSASWYQCTPAARCEGAPVAISEGAPVAISEVTKTPCENFKRGKCWNKSKCLHSHDMPREVCRNFTAYGRCLNEDTCAYVHPKVAVAPVSAVVKEKRVWCWESDKGWTPYDDDAQYQLDQLMKLGFPSNGSIRVLIEGIETKLEIRKSPESGRITQYNRASDGLRVLRKIVVS
eukprot:TRINITY_DN1581_c0_g1_i1.p1 TRINITY_DN1581_c0_g1~~TRINITY_DN1581_c0_g1_i1.p1  ORF type:complete len:210 (+),score=11.98 TRINITY_DN1581_c0_g1_i1:64-693(+)